MPFGDIVYGLDRFIAANAFADALGIFIHIPKTAGSSLGTELGRMRRPYINIHRRYFYGDTVTFSRIEDDIDDVVHDGVLPRTRSCSGHFSWTQAAPLRAARPDARTFTFLRDPVARIVSDYRYSRTPSHPTYAQTIARFPTIEQYIDAPETRDKMARFTIPPDVVARPQIDAFVSTHYAFIGLLEAYPMSFNILARLLGHDRLPSEHKRRTEATQENAVALTDELRAAIADRNPRDVALYQIVQEKLATVTGEWMAGR